MKKKIWLFMLAIVGASFLLTNGCKKSKDSTDNTPAPTTVTDADGNVYHFVIIGTQVWMVENLKTTKFNDGTVIPVVSDSAAWRNLTTPGFCWYKNDPDSYKNTYGALYNWAAVNTGKLAPAGWHVPSDAEWTTLTSYLGGAGIAGGMMKDTMPKHWAAPNTGATNGSGFTALPGGMRWFDGSFMGMGNYNYLWSSSSSYFYFVYRQLEYNSASVVQGSNSGTEGFTVRCLKDF